ncbi:15469_t:CDS:2 [Entrophospora sp. SA101]|nr:15469_t:CDS:2 [Entrophospora sp. SA101]
MLEYELDDVTKYPRFVFDDGAGRRTFFSACVEDFIAVCGDSIKIIELEATIKSKEQQLTTLQQQSTTSTAQLRKEITDLKKQLQETQSNYQQSQQERDKLATQIQQLTTKNQELETQLTALAVSSGLLTQQCEDLSKKLTASEQKEAQTKLEKEIQVNLLQQKDQEEKIKNYQNILRQAEANLTNCQKIITTKSEELTKLEEEKEKINEELETAQEKIKDLETNFLASQTKIMELEARIQELEKDNSNSQELEKIKKELQSLLLPHNRRKSQKKLPQLLIENTKKSTAERLEKNDKYKILPSHQFHYVKETKGMAEAQAHLSFPELLTELTSFEGANWEYAQPLVAELLLQIQPTNQPNLSEYLIKRHDIRQGNGYDCGIAVISIIKRIIDLTIKQS